MTELSKSGLLAKIGETWNALQGFLATLTPMQRTQPADAAGWTVKDHAIHLSLWEDNLIALLEGRSRIEDFDIPQSTWDEGSDAINAVLQPRHRDRPWDDVRQAMIASHQRVLDKVASMTEEQLLLPYNHYQPGVHREGPIIWWINGNTWEHYPEHAEWMRAIVGAPEHEGIVAGALRQFDQKWDELWTFLTALSEEQIADMADAAGWTVKDHAMHLAQWHETFPALLDGKSRAEALGISQQMWNESFHKPGGWDEINAVIQQRYRDLPTDEVLSRLRANRDKVRARIEAMSDADAVLPYNHYQPSSTVELPVANWMRINTYEHYDEHLEWMHAIIEASS
jgi:hypothetical protein